MQGPENKFRDSKVRPFLDKLPHCEHFIKEAKSLRGHHDIIGCANSKFFSLEVKASRSELGCKRTALQQVFRTNYSVIAKGFSEFIYPENAREIMEALIAHAYENKQASKLRPLLDAYFPET